MSPVISAEVFHPIKLVANRHRHTRIRLKEPGIEIDTNLVENAIRPTALGKKIWLFFGDAEAGGRSADIKFSAYPYEGYVLVIFQQLDKYRTWGSIKIPAQMIDEIQKALKK